MDDLKEQLEALKWNDLRSKASKDYGIKLLPEYKASDIIRLILDKQSSGTSYVVDRQDIADKNSKHGWSKIKVMPGRQELGSHCRANHNGYQFAIPFDVEVNIPTVTALYLTTKKVPVPRDTLEGGTEIKHENRWNVEFIEKNLGPKGEIDFIPPEVRGKYWNNAREAKLAIKRAFFEQNGFWPTDKVLKARMDGGYFAFERRQELAKNNA